MSCRVDRTTLRRTFGRPARLLAAPSTPRLQARFEVADKGIGIPVEDQARLFESFHHAANVGVIPGTGLGLAIVKHAVEIHGGSIPLASAAGQGTTFVLKLPSGGRLA